MGEAARANRRAGGAGDRRGGDSIFALAAALRRKRCRTPSRPRIGRRPSRRVLAQGFGGGLVLRLVRHAGLHAIQVAACPTGRDHDEVGGASVHRCSARSSATAGGHTSPNSVWIAHAISFAATCTRRIARASVRVVAPTSSRVRSRWRSTIASCVHRSRSTFARSRGSISALSASPTSLPSRQRPSSLPPRRDGLLRDGSTFVDPVLPPRDRRHRRRRSVPHRSIDAGRCRGTPMARIASRWSDAGVFGVDLAGVLRGLAWPEAEPSRAAMHSRLNFTPHPSSPDAQHRGGARLLRPRRARPIRPIGPSPPGNRAPLPSPAP